MPQPLFPAPVKGKSSILRPHADVSRKATGISALVFFASVIVVGAWGLSGYQDGEEELPQAQLVYAGGAPQQTSGGTAEGQVKAGIFEEEYVVGEFGEPVDQLYSDDEEGGWGESALDIARKYPGKANKS